MDTDLQYLKSISSPREKRSMMLSYRRYLLLGRLHGGIGQVTFDKYRDKYTPKLLAYALSLYFHQRIIEPFNKYHFDEAIRLEKLWDEIWANQPYVHIELTDKQLQKQFEFMGYVKEENFKFHDLYAYVSSNREVNGHFYILNKKFVDNIDAIDIRQSYPYIYNTWDDYALEGYTKILTHGTRP